MRTGPDFYCQAYIASGSVAYIYIFIKSHIFSFPARFTSPMHAGYVYRVMLRSHCARDRVATVDRRSQCKRSIRFRWACVIKLRSHRTKLSEPSWQHCYEHVYFSDSFHVPLKHCSQLRLRLSTILLIKILKPLSSSTSDKTWKYSVITLRPSSTSNDIISFSVCSTLIHSFSCLSSSNLPVCLINLKILSKTIKITIFDNMTSFITRQLFYKPNFYNDSWAQLIDVSAHAPAPLKLQPYDAIQICLFLLLLLLFEMSFNINTTWNSVSRYGS